MADESDDSDYCYYGQAIADEIESKGGSFRKPVQDQAATRSLPIWQQEPTDEQGRKRFHGEPSEPENGMQRMDCMDPHGLHGAS